jgi:eukaryotic-like serine/threonine-protein kinase
MTLASGNKLGPYEILSLLGAGGMGEVYRARDTRLERMVAIAYAGAGPRPSAAKKDLDSDPFSDILHLIG